jgi:hypothetical protein
MQNSLRALSVALGPEFEVGVLSCGAAGIAGEHEGLADGDLLAESSVEWLPLP